MKIEDAHQFIFHPWSEDHSLGTKIAATVADITLSIFTVGLFLIPFIYYQWNDREVTVVKTPTPASAKAQETLRKPDPSPSSLTTNSHLSPKAKAVKEKQAWQLDQFEQWAKAGQWNKIHSAHYDWWMYPIDKSSGKHGVTYQLNSNEIMTLKSDPEFMNNYRRGVVLGAKAWGWDVLGCKPIENPTKDQKWQDWNVRLGKMADSLHLFGEEDLRQSMRKYVQDNHLYIDNWVLRHLGIY